MIYKYTVCTRCYTYNQEAFILDALNGFAMQETTFPVVSCIVDDASTDSEPQVLRDYFNTHFDVDDSSCAFRENTDYGEILFARHKTNKNCYFAIVLLKDNHYKKKSKRQYLTRWIDNSKYIALCEGDDYWTDPKKLQVQVEYMESHPQCSLAVHAAFWKKNGEFLLRGCQEPCPNDYSVEKLIRLGGLYFATASFVYKPELDGERPDWRRKAGVGDFPLQILAGIHGTVHYYPERMCVYRYQSNGAWSQKMRSEKYYIGFLKNKIEWMTLLDNDTGHKYRKAIYDQLYMHFHELYKFREIGVWEYAKAVHRSGEKRYRLLIMDYLKVELTPLYHLLIRLFK